MATDKATVKKAIAEAKRFIAAAEQLTFDPQHENWPVTGVKPAACRRASMDLTRALAELRKYR